MKDGVLHRVTLSARQTDLTSLWLAVLGSIRLLTIEAFLYFFNGAVTKDTLPRILERHCSLKSNGSSVFGRAGVLIGG